jgi:hypothetical protein
MFTRTLLGLFAVVVFGRAVTNALQNLRTFDRQAFDEWYGPWKQEMEEDPLLRWFYKLRSDILKGIVPLIGFVIGSSGRGDLYAGAITVPDRPPPNIHRQQSIQDCAMINLCRLYVAYLEELVAFRRSCYYAGTGSLRHDRGTRCALLAAWPWCCLRGDCDRTGDLSLVSYRHLVGYCRSPGNLASCVTRSIGECRMSLWSAMVVSTQAHGSGGGRPTLAALDDYQASIWNTRQRSAACSNDSGVPLMPSVRRKKATPPGIFTGNSRKIRARSD